MKILNATNCEKEFKSLLAYMDNNKKLINPYISNEIKYDFYAPVYESVEEFNYYHNYLKTKEEVQIEVEKYFEECLDKVIKEHGRNYAEMWTEQIYPQIEEKVKKSFKEERNMLKEMSHDGEHAIKDKIINDGNFYMICDHNKIFSGEEHYTYLAATTTKELALQIKDEIQTKYSCCDIFKNIEILDSSYKKVKIEVESENE